VRSRITCQRIDGSESSSQSMTDTIFLPLGRHAAATLAELVKRMLVGLGDDISVARK